MKLLLGVFLFTPLVIGAQALVIQCDFLMRPWLYLETEYVYTCDGKILEKGNESVVERVEGTHLPGLTNNHVVGFNFHSQEISSIPRNISNYFPSILGLNFYRSFISVISADDLKPFPQLIYFRVMSNKIFSIDGDLFMHNLNLHYIDFDQNLLRNVGHNLLGNLSQLRTVDFQRNPCINSHVTTPDEIRALNDLLPINCPPLPTTTTEAIQTTTSKSPEVCSLRCTLNDEVSKLQQSNSIKTVEISRLSDAFEELQVRVVEVEKQLRELMGSPHWQK